MNLFQMERSRALTAAAAQQCEWTHWHKQQHSAWPAQGMRVQLTRLRQWQAKWMPEITRYFIRNNSNIKMNSRVSKAGEYARNASMQARYIPRS